VGAWRYRPWTTWQQDRAMGLTSVQARWYRLRWSRQAVVTRRLMIDLFELKFDRLNTNSIV
jgi:hypothetical protein